MLGKSSENSKGLMDDGCESDVNDIYPLVNSQFAIENGHRNS